MKASPDLSPSRAALRQAIRLKMECRLKVIRAIRQGVLKPADRCEECGREPYTKRRKRLDGHHDDYAFPLSVRWLCPKCHARWHATHGNHDSSKWEKHHTLTGIELEDGLIERKEQP